jgi:hypothetical protein
VVQAAKHEKLILHPILVPRAQKITLEQHPFSRAMPAIYMYERGTASYLRTLGAHSDVVGAAKFSANGRIVVTELITCVRSRGPRAGIRRWRFFHLALGSAA